MDERVGKSLRTRDQAARDWALRVLLTGRHDRRGTWRFDPATRADTFLSTNNTHCTRMSQQISRCSNLSTWARTRASATCRINNSLGSLELIRQFDVALAELKNSAGLILDLRNTPSGGNSTVARGIMGRFIGREGFYQKHSIPSEESFGAKRSWMEIVSPRGDFRFDAPVVILVDHWTGSMGEGIAIGMDGLKRATIVGTEMAGLLGATSGITLPISKIGVNFPVRETVPRERNSSRRFRTTRLC